MFLVIFLITSFFSIILRDSEKAEREFERAGYFLHAAYMSKIGFETHYALERGVQESLCVQNLIFAINNNKLRLNEAICKKLMEHIYYRRGKVTVHDIPNELKDKTGHFKLSKGNNLISKFIYLFLYFK